VVLRLLKVNTEGAMGTVGLSFGSPTSGAGFDVSTTVSSIVANLQNVETPWKTQLKTLESQDTAISSLGTLFSTLSTDISSLTDATGVLSEKEGSSSNTSVLTLTSASTSATAGTHTVKVTSLAQTSSGYLAEITNSSDTLSGSITLKVGSGTAQTITLDSSDDTLSGLASAINSSGVGITASVLTDSSGSRLSLVSGTSGADGNITVSANSVADATTSSGTLAYTSAVTGANAQLTVDGVALTSASNTVTDMIPGVTFQLLSTSDTAVQVVIANYNTDVESTVATLVSDYNSLVSVMSTQEGDDSSGNPEPLFGSPTLSLLQQQLLSGLNLQNPNGYLTSISSSADTTLSGSMTITVGGGTAHTITLDSSDDTLSGLASAINSAGIGITAAVVTNNGNSTLTLTSQTSGSNGALAITSNITATSGTSTTTLNYTNSSDINSLTSLGISVNNNGTLSLDVTSLDSVLNSDFSGVMGFFQNADSWGQTFSNTLTNAGSSSTTGILSLASSSNSSIESTLNAEISRENTYISAQQTSLTAELNSANEIMQEIPTKLDGINELYSAITGYNSSSS
jgi:flagellar hook-associated protein 2